jgi:hypothetical protein
MGVGAVEPPGWEAGRTYGAPRGLAMAGARSCSSEAHLDAARGGASARNPPTKSGPLGRPDALTRPSPRSVMDSASWPTPLNAKEAFSVVLRRDVESTPSLSQDVRPNTSSLTTTA